MRCRLAHATACLLAAAVMSTAGFGAVSGSEKGRKEEARKEEPLWQGRVVPGPAVTLRVKRGIGKFLIYEGSMERSQTAKNSYNEQSTFYLNVLCADQASGLDLIATKRDYTKRERTERYQGGREIKVLKENVAEQIDLGENFSLVGTLRCYAFDDQNRIAYRSEQVLTLRDGQQLRGSVLSQDKEKVVFLTREDKLEFKTSEVANISVIPLPHVLMNDTPHYLFPFFPERAVAPGETWQFKIPVIIPLPQGNPPRILPTQFDVNLSCGLRQAQGGIAVIDYRINGTFDSKGEDFQGRFPGNFHELNQVKHGFKGGGTVKLDIEKGRITEKSETFQIHLYAGSLVSQGVDKPAKLEESKADLLSTFRIRLMMPGEKLKAGVVIPAYD